MAFITMQCSENIRSKKKRTLRISSVIIIKQNRYNKKSGGITNNRKLHVIFPNAVLNILTSSSWERAIRWAGGGGRSSNAITSSNIYYNR